MTSRQQGALNTGSDESAEAVQSASSAAVAKIKVCPRCGDPVIFTMEFPGVEYVCVACQWKGDVFAPDVVSATDDRAALYETRLHQYERERAARSGRPVPKPAPQDVPRPRCKGCGVEATGYLDHSGKPPHWYSRTVKGVTDYACSRDCIKEGTVAPW